jgi:hypothetical protein
MTRITIWFNTPLTYTNQGTTNVYCANFGMLRAKIGYMVLFNNLEKREFICRRRM